MKNDWNFTKGEWEAAIAMLLIIIFSYLFYYLYDNHKKPPIDFRAQEAAIAAFMVRQQYFADSIETADHTLQYYRYDITEFSRDTIPRKPKKLLYEIVKIDLNHSDTTQIVNVPQFGSKRAAKLVQYREQLGGFHSLSQVREIYILQDMDLEFLAQYFYVNPKDVHKININTASYAELIKHPYFDAYLTKTIVNYRNKHGPITSLDELQQITHAYPELMEKLKYYIAF